MCSNNNSTVRPLIERLDNQSETIISLNEIQKNTKYSYLRKLDQTEYAIRQNKCICSNDSGILISEVDRYGLPTKTYLCEICGTMRTDPCLTEKSLSQFYDNEYRPLYVGTETCTDGFFNEQRNIGRNIYNFIKKHYELNDNLIIYEIGCGAGGILQFFKEKGCIVAGCDLGSTYIEFGRQKGLDLRMGGFETLENEKKAEIIILNHVLEHISKPREYLSEIKNLMKDDGILFISLPGIFNIKNACGDFAYYLQNAHIYHFNLTSLDYLLNSSGYKRIYGDEKIRALYKKSKSKKNNYDDLNANEIIKYLLNIEKKRHLYMNILKLRFLFYKVVIFCRNNLLRKK